MVEGKQPTYLDTLEIDEESEALEGYIVDPSRYADNAVSFKDQPRRALRSNTSTFGHNQRSYELEK
jgi:hypothetical protein